MLSSLILFRSCQKLAHRSHCELLCFSLSHRSVDQPSLVFVKYVVADEESTLLQVLGFVVSVKKKIVYK
jgi:hypothetical protein